MDEDIIIIGLLITLGIGGVAVVVGAWLPRGKKLPDWFMATGGTMALAASGFMVLLSTGGLPDPLRNQMAGIAAISAIALGILLFAMGYVMDRWQRRTVQEHERSLP